MEKVCRQLSTYIGGKEKSLHVGKEDLDLFEELKALNRKEKARILADCIKHPRRYLE